MAAETTLIERPSTQDLQRPDEIKPNTGGRFVIPISKQGQNVGSADRAFSAAVGSALVVYGLKHRSAFGVLLGAVGVFMVNQGVTGHSRFYQWFGINTATGDFPSVRAGATAKSEDTQPLQDPNSIAPKVMRAHEVKSSITIGKSANELYDIWRDPNQLALIMKHFATVTAPDTTLTHWSVPLFKDQLLEWDTRVVEEHPDEVLSWESVPGSHLQMRGEVRFLPAPGNRGTEVHLRLQFEPPGGVLGEVAAKFFHIVPGTIATKSLRSLKALAESGEIPTLEKNSTARTSVLANAF